MAIMVLVRKGETHAEASLRLRLRVRPALADLERAVLDEDGRHGAAPLVQLGLDELQELAAEEGFHRADELHVVATHKFEVHDIGNPWADPYVDGVWSFGEYDGKVGPVWARPDGTPIDVNSIDRGRSATS